jgi:hypothetical protein
MIYPLTYKSKQFFWLFIKLSIVFGCGYFIWTRLIVNSQLTFPSFYQKLVENNIFSFKNTVLLCLLSFFNWFFEILKWHTLVHFVKKISFSIAAIQSLASLTTSLITPNRIGEYGAKAFYFKKTLRKRILSLNLVGNLHQLLATLFFGILSLIYFISNQKIDIALNKFSYLVLIGFTIVFAFLLLWKYKISKRKIFKNYIVSISTNKHLKVSSLSCLRYFIFSHQFYFLLFIFNTDLSYLDAITAISSLYLISSLVPMLSLFDVILKGTVAVFIFTFLQVDAVIALSITTLMWVLNFVIPAIIGCYFVLTFNPKLTT